MSRPGREELLDVPDVCPTTLPMFVFLLPRPKRKGNCQHLSTAFLTRGNGGGGRTNKRFWGVATPTPRFERKKGNRLLYACCVCKSRSGIIRGCAAVIAPELDTFKGSLHSKEMYMYIKASAIGRGPNDDMAGEGEFSVAQIYAE